MLDDYPAWLLIKRHEDLAPQLQRRLVYIVLHKTSFLQLIRNCSRNSPQQIHRFVLYRVSSKSLHTQTHQTTSSPCSVLHCNQALIQPPPQALANALVTFPSAGWFRDQRSQTWRRALFLRQVWLCCCQCFPSRGVDGCSRGAKARSQIASIIIARCGHAWRRLYASKDPIQLGIAACAKA